MPDPKHPTAPRLAAEPDSPTLATAKSKRSTSTSTSSSNSNSRRSGKATGSGRDRGREKTRERKGSKSEPSTIRVLSYVSIVYLAYGLFTRSDEHEHLSPTSIHVPNLNLHLPNTHDLSHLAHQASSTASRAVRYSTDYVQDTNANLHVPRARDVVDGVERIVGEGVEKVGRGVRGVVGDVVGHGHGVSGREDNGGGKKVYTMSFPSNPFGAQRTRGTNHNLFILLLTRSFSLLIHFPLVLLFNILSHAFHYISLTLFLLLWTTYYLTLPITSSVTWLTQTFVLGPVGMVWAVMGFFKPIAGLLGGLMGFGAAVGGVVGWVGKRLEGGVWKKAEERVAKDRMEKEKVEIKRLREQQTRVDGTSLVGFGRDDGRSQSHNWLLPSPQYRSEPQPQLSAWADDDHLYRPRQAVSFVDANAIPVQVYPSQSVMYPIHTGYPTPAAYPYPPTYPYPQPTTGIMKRPTNAIASSSRRKTHSRDDPSENDRTRVRSRPISTAPSTPENRTSRMTQDGKRKVKIGHRISFAAEPTYPISDDDDDEEDDVDDDELDDGFSSDAGLDDDDDAASSSRAFHFHFHTPQGGLPTTPYRKRNSGGGTNDRVTSSARVPSGSSGSGSGSASGEARSTARQDQEDDNHTGGMTNSSRISRSKHVSGQSINHQTSHGQSEGEREAETPTKLSRGTSRRGGRIARGPDDGWEQDPAAGVGMRKRSLYKGDDGQEVFEIQG